MSWGFTGAFMRWTDLSGATKTAVILAIVGFFIKFEWSSTGRVNGVASCTYSDYGALGLGGLTVLAAVAGLFLVRALAAPQARRANLLASGGALLVGAFHLARGLGFIGGPC